MCVRAYERAGPGINNNNKQIQQGDDATLQMVYRRYVEMGNA